MLDSLAVAEPVTEETAEPLFTCLEMGLLTWLPLTPIIRETLPSCLCADKLVRASQSLTGEASASFCTWGN